MVDSGEGGGGGRIFAPPAARRPRQRRRRLLRAVAPSLALLFFIAFFLIFQLPQISTREAGGGKGEGEVEINTASDEPDIRPWWEALRRQPAATWGATAGCNYFLAPENETMRLAPACAVGDGVRLGKRPCTKEELTAGSLSHNGGATRARCVTRGFQRKCYVENIILLGDNFFTFRGKGSGVPSKLFLADGRREPLAKYHHYYGNSVQEVANLTDDDDSILNHCKYLITVPIVFLYRMSGHSTYHLWLNNLGPFFDTLNDDFGIKDKKSGEGVFGGETPVIITVDHKPRHDPKSPFLLDELLHYFTWLPILNASEFNEPTCFTRAILGTSSSSFNQATLRHWLLPRIALRHRLLQFISEKKEGINNFTITSSTMNSSLFFLNNVGNLRCLIQRYNESFPLIVKKWFDWKIRHWQRLPYVPRVLYLSRNHPNITRGRKVVNEADVIPALESAVLTITGGTLRRAFLEEMSYVDQIMTMSETNILIAPHGGGIANCVWMPPGSVVVEFVAPAGATLPEMYHKMCRQAAGRIIHINNVGSSVSVPPIQHIPFIAAQDPAERNEGFSAANPAWKKNRRLFSNIWMPTEKLIQHFANAVKLYRQAWSMTRNRQ